MKALSLSALYALTKQFFHFGMVGIVGFTVDWATTSFLSTIIPLKIAVLFAYSVAASGNWLLNRLWTFRHADHETLSPFHQWKRFLIANLPGFFINRGVVLAVLSYVTIAQQWPVIALLCGTACGMFVNFTLCRTCVFDCKETEKLDASASLQEKT